MSSEEREPPPPIREPIPGKEYYIKSAGAWYKGTNRQGLIFTNVKRREGDAFVDVPSGIKEFGSGATFYELTPAATEKVVKATKASTASASAEEGGKRHRRKTTRKGSRKSRRTTRRKRFT